MCAQYEDHESVMILEPEEEGDSLKKIVRTTRTEDGETVEYVSLKSGHIESTENMEGEKVLVQRISDSTSLGSPEYIDELAEGLLELKEKIDNNS